MIIVGKILDEIFDKYARYLKFLPSTIRQFLSFMIFLGLLGCSIFSKGNKDNSQPKEVYIFEVQKEPQKTLGFYIRTDAAPILNYKTSKDRIESFLECSNRKVALRQIKIQSESEDIPSLPMLCFVSADDGELNEKNCKSSILTQNGEKFQFPFKIQQVEGSLFSYAYMFEISDSLVLFGIDVVRTNRSDDEYFPTSERLRVEIQNMLGKPVWRSDEDVYFLQVMGDVEPKEIGSCYRYVKFWSRRDNVGRFVANGRFKVMLTLPIQPKPIIKYLEINLGE